MWEKLTLLSIKQHAKSKGFKLLCYAIDVDACTFGKGNIMVTIDHFNSTRKTCRFEVKTVGTINECKSRIRAHGYLQYDAVTVLIDSIDEFLKTEK